MVELEPKIVGVSEFPRGFAVKCKNVLVGVSVTASVVRISVKDVDDLVCAVVVEVVVEVCRSLVVIRLVVAVVVVCSRLQSSPS